MLKSSKMLWTLTLQFTVILTKNWFPYVPLSAKANVVYYIYTKDGVEEIVNLQPKGSKAKAYQVKQVRQMILKYHFGGAINE